MSTSSDTLASTAVSGAFWTSVSRFGQQALTLITTAVLARLLSPTDYGIVGMATIVTGFISVFTELGISSAIIRRDMIDDEFLSSLFWVNLALGVTACGVLVSLAGAVAGFYHEPQLKGILYALSTAFVLSGSGIVPFALLNRYLAFRRLAIVELGSCLAASAVAIALAVSGYGVWSLVYSSLANALIRAVLIWFALSWRPRLDMRMRDIRSIASYSLNLSGFTIFNYFSRNADNLIIGRYLGASQLGYYQLAYNLMLYPIQAVISILGRVLFPAFAHMKHDNTRFRQAYLRVSSIISLITFPLMLGLLLTADSAVMVAFGPQWLPAVPIIRILCPIGMLQSVGTIVGHIYTAKGRTDWMFCWGIVFGLSTVGAFVVGLHWGPIGVATGYAFVTVVLAYPDFAIPFSLIKLKVSVYLTSWTTALKYSVAMVVVAVTARAVLIFAGVDSPVVLLSGTVAAGSVTYALLLIWRKPAVVEDIFSLLAESKFPGIQHLRSVGAR